MKPTLTLITTLIASASLHAAPDLLIADFEGETYGDWKVEGEAFGQGPAKGSLPGQMPVSGFKGERLVNSFFKGDNTLGTLTSPPFKVERKFITFLIGGGGYGDETCMNLLIDGKVVRSATGSNIRGGGSEALAPAAWDVAEWVGKIATIAIIDNRKGGWGHINIDHIVQTDDKGQTPPAVVVVPPPPPAPERVRTVTISGDFLQLPLMRHAVREREALEKLSVEADGKLLRYMHIKLPAAGQQPDFMYSADMREFKGRKGTLRIRSHDELALERLEFSDREIIDPQAYEGPNRPHFHFSPRLGWMNDINGTYYLDGLYHLFYQFNPAATGTGAGFDMHWGHSVSKDLVHWEEWPVALFPNGEGQCYSGTSIVVKQPIPGLIDKVPAPAMFFTATTPSSQHLATTPDGGRTWKRYPGNPVVPKMGAGDRDPKVIWHEASQHYVMVLYVGSPDTFRIFRSKDLVNWEQTQSIPGWYECPEFIPFKSPTSGEDLMLLYGNYTSPEGSAETVRFRSAYQLGHFDGSTFTPVTPVRRAHQGPNFYGSLIFMNEPKDRPILMGWTSGSRFPDEPFNQCASVPLEMKLKAINGEDTLCFEPTEEINTLRGQPIIKLTNVSVAEANEMLATLEKSAALDVVLRFKTASLRVSTRSLTFDYDAANNTLTSNRQTAVLHPGASLDARFLLDRGIVEAFWSDGEAAYSAGSLHTDAGPAFALEGEARIEELIVYPMKNIWPSSQRE